MTHLEFRSGPITLTLLMIKFTKKNRMMELITE